MAQFERIKGQKENSSEKGNKPKGERSSDCLKASDESLASSTYHAVKSSRDAHTRQLTDAKSETQRAKVAKTLQQNYGNQYVQRLLKLGKESKGATQNQTPATSINLSNNKNGTTLNLSISALVKREENPEGEMQEVQDETSEVEEETIPSIGCDYSFKNSAINLHQNAQRGNVSVPGTAFGECGEGYIRCCYATSMPDIEEAFTRIKRFLDRHGS